MRPRFAGPPPTLLMLSTADVARALRMTRQGAGNYVRGWYARSLVGDVTVPRTVLVDATTPGRAQRYAVDPAGFAAFLAAR